MSSRRVRSYVDGDWLDGAGEEVADVNPARPDHVVASYRKVDSGQLESAIAAASHAFALWRSESIHRRAEVLAGAADLVEERAEELGAELASEEGRRLADAIAEAHRVAAIFRFFAAEAERSDGETFAGRRERERIWVHRRPVGPVALITPWNLPLAIPAWKLAPALLYGNTVVWKPAGIVPLTAVSLTAILLEAGLPPGVCNLVLADGPTSEALLRTDAIAACSFTGSTAVGKRLVGVGAEGGIRVHAEMGGKNAAIVCADADLGDATRQVVSGAMGFSGQRCTATARAIVAREVFDDFCEGVICEVSELTVGDPLDEGTDVGPLASSEQLERVLGYFDAARADGGTVAVGGEGVQRDGGGYFVRPTVVADARPGHRVFDEEVFGPLLAVVPADDIDEALALANHGPFGLSGSIFTRDLDRVFDVVERFDVGVLHVNSETAGADPHVPFGGVRESGTADREMGRAARDFYTELQTVYLRPAG